MLRISSIVVGSCRLNRVRRSFNLVVGTSTLFRNRIVVTPVRIRVGLDSLDRLLGYTRV